MMYLCRVGVMGAAHKLHGTELGSVVPLVGAVGATCVEKTRDAVPGSIPKLWVTLGYHLLG